MKPLRLLPPLALMGLIFFLSAQPDLSTGLGFWDLVLRKLAHITAFGLLTVLWWRALAGTSDRALLAAAAISLLYAVSDEYHQSFVEGRSGSPVDVAIDAAGIGLAAALILRRPATGIRRRGGQHRPVSSFDSTRPGQRKGWKSIKEERWTRS